METAKNPCERDQALNIVRGILSPIVAPERIVFGMAKTYAPILLDGKSSRTICRLYFNANKTIGILNTRRVETKTRIDSTEDIKVFAADMKMLVAKYG